MWKMAMGGSGSVMAVVNVALPSMGGSGSVMAVVNVALPSMGGSGSVMAVVNVALPSWLWEKDCICRFLVRNCSCVSQTMSFG